MREFARILVVDDDRKIADRLSEWLVQRGYEVVTSYDEKDALQKLESVSSSHFQVILLDSKLVGEEGGHVGVEMLGQVLNLAPTIRPIIITGYADPDAIERAFRSGAHDYVEKGQRWDIFSTLLLAKIRNALAPVREARLAALTNGSREVELGKLWHAVTTETHKQKKGRALEDLLCLLFRSIPGLEDIQQNNRSQGEEIDLVVTNRSNDPFWKKESTIFLVECKNWMTPVDPTEIDRFFEKMRRRYGRCKLGFFVAPEGFTKGARDDVRDRRREDAVCALLTRPDLERLIQAKTATERDGILQALVLRAFGMGSRGPKADATT